MVVRRDLYLADVEVASPRLVVNGWLDSAAHRENLLRPHWREQAVAPLTGATVDGHEDVHIWVSHFGLRR